MDKESIIGLQKVDCNCSDCKHLLRNNYKLQLSKITHERWDKAEYDRNRDNALALAFAFRDKTELSKLEKEKFQPSKGGVINYGYCKKFDLKEVSFIPNTCQLETQDCFEHRKS